MTGLGHVRRNSLGLRPSRRVASGAFCLTGDSSSCTTHAHWNRRLVPDTSVRQSESVARPRLQSFDSYKHPISVGILKSLCKSHLQQRRESWISNQPLISPTSIRVLGILSAGGNADYHHLTRRCAILLLELERTRKSELLMVPDLDLYASSRRFLRLRHPRTGMSVPTSLTGFLARGA